MTFISFEFLFFFVCLLVLFYSVPKHVQIALLVIASLLFCCYAGGRWMLISLLFATLTTWYAAVKLESAESERQKRFFLYGTLILNLGILVLYKYLNFFIYTGRAAGELLGINVAWNEISLVVPLGISFYTLQVIGYLIDVSRGTCRAQKSLVKYTAFACFFPQLVTGPVNRYSGGFQESLYTEKSFNYEQVTFGFQRIAWGFFKKLIISERMAVIVNTVYGDYQTFNGIYIALATVCFAFQLYTDFSGAMDIALGVSEALGIQMAENFDTPFFARSISEYWRRWHITLGVWMRDYIFYPLLKSEWFIVMGEKAKKQLGKKNGKKVPVYFGMTVLWFMVGMWHGGAWKYIIGSGLLHCFYIILGQVMEPVFKKIRRLFRINTECFGYHLFQALRTFFLVCIGFVFFRASSARTALRMLKASLFSNIWILVDGSLFHLGLGASDIIVCLLSLGVLLIVSLLQQKFHAEGKTVRGILAEQNLAFRWLIYYALVFSIIILGFYGPGYDTSVFIYQNF